MKNLTEGEKMVWAAAYVYHMRRETVAVSIECANDAVIELRSPLDIEAVSIDALETAKEVLK